MKVLTETGLRSELKSNFPKTYLINSDMIVTPSARQYLKEKNIELILDESKDGQKEAFEKGAFENKPEYMTQLYGNLLVKKDHPRIELRGKLDSLQAQILEMQVYLSNNNEKKMLVDLSEVLTFVRNILRGEVLGEPFKEIEILGLNESQLREMSHAPQRFFNIKHILPDYSMGPVLIKLNTLRSLAREVEIAAVKAFGTATGEIERIDLIQALNRLSSCLYIMMCRWQSGHYK